MDLNKQISDFIKGLPENYYAKPENLTYFSKYTGCEEYLLSDEVILETWNWFKENLSNYGPVGNGDIPSSVSILHTNSGLGRILSKSPLNSTIRAYSVCYTCKKISDFMCQKRAENGKYYSFSRDISQYFALCNTNSTKKYSIVITQPEEGMNYYKGIDYVGNIESTDPFEYYITRSLFFVEKGGYLVVVYPLNKEKEIFGTLKSLTGIIEKNIKSLEVAPDYGEDGLNILIIKK